ncbi:MAG TPA: L-seryl-tRNA(Sec) selenium transferase [Planctomycetota bacterium]|nr:L-seryl-tRNA(Sec) selenium transferase [Planctomycetota bacterium]
MNAEDGNPYRSVPSVDELMKHDRATLLVERFGRSPVLSAIRHDLDAVRDAVRRDNLVPADVNERCAPEIVFHRVTARLVEHARRTYIHTINATGVILHTGLGRAALPKAARDALEDAARGYTIVEVDRASGERNRREEAISALLKEITGAPAATVVNNNAAATLISLAALAAGKGVVVSRGQLVEIGGSFRIPDVMAQSGARLVEVGTTNKTHLSDYERALSDPKNEIALVLRVHPSNFKIVGFTEEVPLSDLVLLGARFKVPVMDDLGSGCFVDLRRFGLGEEPIVQDSIAQGADVATFSGDKLLGGPQAGLVVGRKEPVDRIRKHPLFRAMRPDKLTLAAIEATLMLYRDPERAVQEVPALRMIATPIAEIDARARGLEALAAKHVTAWRTSVRDDASMVGGGSYATERIPTRVLALEPLRGSADALARRLRMADPPVFARIADDRVLLDPRTIDPLEDATVARTLDLIASRPDA